jgi:cell division protein FtsQ
MKKTSTTLEIPPDIKLVNAVTSVLFGVFLFLIVLSGIEYILKNKIKNLNAISIKGNILHSDISSIRNNITSNVSGNFYSINLNQTKQIFENIPWINQAVVKRVYPSQIEVKLSEYKSKAIWGAREDMKLVDETGAIFEANTEDDEYDLMPQLIGPEGQGKLMLDMYEDVSTALGPLNVKLKILELNARGSWVAILEGGAHFELGRGNVFDIINRINKFSVGAEQILKKLNKKIMDIQYIDLRHSDGYALRIQGVSTLDLSAVTASLKK